ncbi:pyrophosphatase PpaX [Bacillus kwashiorkori]|uniref:pyrophosphatase PpaX n=1 Tax=Bacillus kwashiorkori TaxID=1522318 RepID=UPI0007855F3A|nr:pyrophosphatase PpaX [Bacillus kwashiorkori]
MSKGVTTILFDLDGTLIDSNELIIQSFLHTFKKYAPNQFTREDCIPLIGPSLYETFSSVDKEKAEEMVEYYRDFNKKYHDELLEQYDGVYETVELLVNRGFKIAVVTTKLKDVVMKGLEASKLTRFFEHIVALDDVANPKPDPEPIFKALNLLDSSPEEAIMVGDSYHDILAAKNAGTKSAAVAWSLKGRDHLMQFKPDYMLEHMSDLLPIVGVE